MLNHADEKAMQENAVAKEANGDVIYLLQAVHQQQVRMNGMADQKANVLVATIGVLFSVILTRLLTQEHALSQSQLVALSVLAVVALTAFAFGIYVLMPRLATGSKGKRLEEYPNPFFFGFFTRVEERDFVDFVTEQVASNKTARQYLARDIYHVGQVLRRKYSVLRKAYLTIFIGGFITLLTYIVMLPLD